MTVHVAHTNVLLVAFTSLDKLKHIEPRQADRVRRTSRL
jgi:hypothetical protein